MKTIICARDLNKNYGKFTAEVNREELDRMNLSYRMFYVFSRNLISYKRFVVPTFLASIIQPIFYLVTFGIGMGAYLGHFGGRPYLYFLVPGVLTVSVMMSSTFECLYGTFVKMVHERTYDALIATPVSAEDAVSGDILWGSFRGLISGTLMITVAIIMGILPVSVASILVLLILMVFVGILFSSLAMIVTSFAPNFDFFTYYSELVITPMKKPGRFFLLILFISASLFADNPETELEKKLQTVSGKEKIQVLNDLANHYFREIPAKTIEYGTQALELSEKLKDEKGKAQALKLIGIGYAILGNLQKAIQFSEKAMEVYEKTGDEINKTNCLNTIGNVYNNLSNYDKALEYHSQALKIRRTLGQKSGISASLNNMGLVYNNLGNFDQALECYLESLKIDEEMGNKIGVSQTLNNIGLVYDNLGNNESALKYYLQALKMAEAIGDKRSIANCLHNIGNVYDNMKEASKALEYHGRAKRFREEIGDKRGLAASLDNMGLIYANQGNYEKALDFYLQSLRLREEIGEKSGVASVLINIGSLYNHLENFDKALINLERALKIAEEIDAKNLLMYIYQYISETYSAMADFKKALEYYKRYSEIKDTVINKQSNDKIAELQAKYEVEKKEKEIALLEKNNRIQTITRNALIAGFVLVLIIVLLLLKKYIYLITFWKKKNYIGHYRINSQIGSGGMGVVYKASHVRQGSRPVAIKVIREEYSQDPLQRKRFLNEAILVDQMNHPNIVKVLERGEYNQQLFIAMELLEGQSLADLIQKGENIPIKDGLNIMIQLVNALAKVHSKGIIHRDIKPENILLIEKEENKYFVKLLDFGLAKSQSLTRLTETGQILGTINYLPPEQITHQKVSPASDIYALGAVFYEMLTLEKPFLGEFTIDIIKQIIEKEPIEPRKLRPEIPVELNDLIVKMLSKKLETRPTDEMVLTSIEDLHNNAQ